MMMVINPNFSPITNVLLNIFYWICLVPLCIAFYNSLEYHELLDNNWIILSAVYIYSLLYTSILYTIIRSIVFVIRRKKSGNGGGEK